MAYPNAVVLVLMGEDKIKNLLSVTKYVEEGMLGRSCPHAVDFSMHITNLSDALIFHGQDRLKKLPLHDRQLVVFEKHFTICKKGLDSLRELEELPRMLKPEMVKNDGDLDLQISNLQHSFTLLTKTIPYDLKYFSFGYYKKEGVPDVIILPRGLYEGQLERLDSLIEKALEERSKSLEQNLISFEKMVVGLSNHSYSNLNLPQKAPSLLDILVYDRIEGDKEFQTNSETDLALSEMKDRLVDLQKLEKSMCIRIQKKKGLDMNASNYEDKAKWYTVKVNNVKKIMHRMRFCNPELEQTDFAKQVISINTNFGLAFVESYSRAMEKLSKKMVGLMKEVNAVVAEFEESNSCLNNGHPVQFRP